jgi:hypothetical protein
MKIIKTPGGHFRLMGMVCLAAMLLGAGCRQSKEEAAAQKVRQQHERERQEKNALMKDVRGPNGARINEGAHFLFSLKANGRLPGLTRSDEIRVGSEKTTITTNGAWFLSEEFHLVTKPPTRYFGYVLVQTYDRADFQLQKAWRTDVAGKVLENYLVLPEPARADPDLIFLGPANPGAETGFDHWYHGVTGGGSVAIDVDDPATGFQDFRLGITNAPAGGTHHADIRSETFPLGPDGKLRGPFTFSFKYKLPGTVKPGDNIEVYFRFYGPGKDNFLGQDIYYVGSNTDDSEMTKYKTMTVTNLFATDGAVQADVWMAANIFGPWTSGEAQFDAFSVTAARGRSRTEMFVLIGTGAVLAGGLAGWLWLRGGRNRGRVK